MERINTAWYAHEPSEAENIKKIVLGSKNLLDIVSKLCYNRLNDLNKITSSDYDSPSWAYKQSHINGQKEELERLIKLITIN